MFKQQKGITLIALVITIIVLLILAGITIAMLTGRDSAPAKANEAKQKQDIGSVKDQLYILAQNAQLDFYNDTYVKDGAVSASSVGGTASKKEVGIRVATALTTGMADGKGIGDAKVHYSTAATSNTDTTHNHAIEITIETRDYHINGYVELQGGALKWDSTISEGSQSTATSLK